MARVHETEMSYMAHRHYGCIRNRRQNMHINARISGQVFDGTEFEENKFFIAQPAIKMK